MSVPGTPSLYKVAQAHRKALMARDTEALRSMVQAYQPVVRTLRQSLYELTAQIEAATREGEPVSLAWLFRQERYQSLLAQVRAQIDDYGRQAGVSITRVQQLSLFHGGSDAAIQVAALLRSAGSPLTVTFAAVLPAEATAAQVGFLADGSPLADLLAELGPVAEKATRDALVRGVAIGRNPRETARLIARDVFPTPLRRILKITRTEQIRSYRAAAIATYQESGAVEKWRWNSAKSARTCSACLAMDGQEFALDVPFTSHPQCRCSPVPCIAGYTPDWQTGAEWLAAQPADVQDEILGIAAGAAYREGKVDLADFIHADHSAEWGTSYRQASLAAALAKAGERSDT